MINKHDTTFDNTSIMCFFFFNKHGRVFFPLQGDNALIFDNRAFNPENDGDNDRIQEINDADEISSSGEKVRNLSSENEDGGFKEDFDQIFVNKCPVSNFI